MKENKLSIKKEEDFHDDWADSISIEDVLVDESFEACTAPENRIIMKKLGDVRGKKVLDLGCGAGEASVYFAKKGAYVTATDLSGGMLALTKKVAEKHDVKINVAQCPSDALPFEKGSFDVVYAANLLHHVELDPTLKEVCRVLRDGGVFVSWDPLAHNPLINIYRNKAFKVRTADEHPLRMEQIKTFGQFFKNVEVDTTWFFTLWLLIRYYLIERIDPNKERYWKKILADHKKLERTYYALESLDRAVLSLLPFLRRYCWNIVMFCVK